eukprot:Sdes_comp20251_c0_seq2m13690
MLRRLPRAGCERPFIFRFFLRKTNAMWGKWRWIKTRTRSSIFGMLKCSFTASSLPIPTMRIPPPKRSTSSKLGCSLSWIVLASLCQYFSRLSLFSHHHFLLLAGRSAVEQFIEGPYRKHNNNYGYVNEDERNTPQAFSHFTYEASNHGSLVCDIQGVGDLYTDPQMHTTTEFSFGRGNLGRKGVEKFLQTHRCNAICRYLKLPSINAKPVDAGTIPSTKFMQLQHVEVVDLRFPSLPGEKSAHKDWVSSLLKADSSNGLVACCTIL